VKATRFANDIKPLQWKDFTLYLEAHRGGHSFRLALKPMIFMNHDCIEYTAHGQVVSIFDGTVEERKSWANARIADAVKLLTEGDSSET